jgi:hypothetical protein
MKKEIKNELMCDIIDILGITATILILLWGFSSCTKHIPNISHPSKKEIRKAMKHSSWEYKHYK